MKLSIWRAAIAGAAAVAVAGATLLTAGAPAGASKPLARAELRNTAGEVVGEVLFKGRGANADRLQVVLNAPNAPNLNDFHGFHIHTKGSCNPAPSGTANVPFGSAEGHWNPGGAPHGLHVGDLPSLLISSDGKAFAELETHRFDVTSLVDAGGDGSAVILHVGRDNFAHIPERYDPDADAATLATGDAGGRYACGVIVPVG